MNPRPFFFLKNGELVRLTLGRVYMQTDFCTCRIIITIISSNEVKDNKKNTEFLLLLLCSIILANPLSWPPTGF